jgi:predicted metal-binding membrane protein
MWTRAVAVRIDIREATFNVAAMGVPRAFARRGVESRATIAVVAVLVALAAVAWAITARQAFDMSSMVSGLADVGQRMPNDMAAPVFMAMWLAMMAAMMLPTVAPMVLAHHMVVGARGEGWVPTAVFAAGYLAVWTAIGVVPLLAFLGFRGLMDPAPRWVTPVAGVVLVVAGIYQFTPWKGACLKACRTPLNFIMTHDFGHGSRGAVRAGVSHGAWCLGCCWALMSVLVVVGLMNLVWMVVLALTFLLEKNWRHGVAVSRIAGTGVALLGVSVLLRPQVLGWLANVHA